MIMVNVWNFNVLWQNFVLASIVFGIITFTFKFLSTANYWSKRVVNQNLQGDESVRINSFKVCTRHNLGLVFRAFVELVDFWKDIYYVVYIEH